jgi:hypothetical protein
MKLTPAFAARLLDLQIENSFSMSASVNSFEEARSGYNMMLDTLRGHAIEWFNSAPFDDEVRSCSSYILNVCQLFVVAVCCSHS